MNVITRLSVDRGLTGSAKSFSPWARVMNGTKQILTGLAFAVVLVALQRDAMAMSVDLGSASGFAVLAGSGMTITGPTSITGDMGTFPTATITGLATLVLAGVNHADDAIAQQAKADLSAAYTSAAGRTPTTLYGAIFDLGEQTLSAGVYNSTASLGITGTLTLDAHGDPNAVWIFQTGSTLTAEVGSKVILINGGRPGVGAEWRGDFRQQCGDGAGKRHASTARPRNGRSGRLRTQTPPGVLSLRATSTPHQYSRFAPKFGVSPMFIA